MTEVDNLYIDLRGYFELSFVIVEADNLDAKLGLLYVFS
jgi:hypothetical protein